MDRLTETFFNLVKIDSPTGQEMALSIFVEELLRRQGNLTETSIDKFGNIYAFKKGQGNPIFLTAHLDTVEPGRGIKPQIKGRFITSDSSTILGADDKAGITAILEAIFTLNDNKDTSHRDIEILFLVSEESGSLGALNFDLKKLKSRFGFSFDGPGNVGNITLSSPFYERFDIYFYGKSGHSSQPSKAINTTPAMAEFLSSLRFGEVEPGVLLNIGSIKSGHVRNSIPGEAILQGEIRTLSFEKLQKHKKIITEKLKSLEKNGLKTRVNFVYENGGYNYSSSDKLIELITNKLQNLKLTPNLINSWGVSDANVLNQRGLKCVDLGIGVENPHTTREKVSLNQLIKTTQLILELVKP